MSKEKVIDISTRKTGKIVGICAAAVAAIIVVVSSVSIVPAGCTGVVTTFGKVSDTALNEGLHLKVPFAQRVTTVSNKIQVYQADADAVSKDLQTVNSTIAVKLPNKVSFFCKHFQEYRLRLRKRYPYANSAGMYEVGMCKIYG